MAMRAVGGWAPGAKKLTSPHRAAHACTIPACCTATRMRCTACMQRTRTSLRAFRGMAKSDTQLYGGVAGRPCALWGVGTQRQKNICAKQIICYIYIYNGTRIFDKVHVLGTAAQQYHENFSHGACGMTWPCARGVVLGTAAPKYRKNNRVGPEPGGLLLRPRGPVSH